MKLQTSIYCAALLCAAYPLDAFADDTDFASCDGYGVPNLKGADGMSTASGMLGIGKVTADLRKAEGSLGAHGVSACERALSDARMLPEYWVRRAHLQQAAALHQLAAKEPLAALQSLEQSDASGAARSSIHFDQSVKLGNRMIRIFALTELGRHEDAGKEVAQLQTARPYSAQIQNLAFASAIKSDPALDTQLKLQKSIIPIAPGKIEQGFWISLIAGRFAEASALGPQISYDLPRSRGNWTVEGENGREYKLIEERAKLAGALAYAQETQGQSSLADATIATAKAQLADAAAPPPEPAPGKKLSKSVVKDYDSRRSFAESGHRLLAPWETAISVRRRAGNLFIEDLLAEHNERSPVMQLPVVGDLLMQLKTRNDVDRLDREAFVKRWYDDMEKVRVKTLTWDVYALREALPRPETQKMQPRFKKAGDGYFLGDSGLSRRQDKDNDSWTIRFAHHVAPGPMVEELAMLGAAMTARDNGKDSFLILSQRTLQRTTTVTSYPYGGSYTQNSGYEAQLLVTLTDQAALPDRYRDAGWRLIPANRVIEALGDRYLSAPEATAK